MKVLEQMSPKADEEASTSARDNMDKNRYITYLPCECTYYQCEVTVKEGCSIGVSSKFSELPSLPWFCCILHCGLRKAAIFAELTCKH